MTIKQDYEARFPCGGPTWIEQVANTWESYTCMVYGDRTKEAILNLIAHLLAVAATPGTGARRNEASKSVGSVSVSYEASPTITSNLGAWYSTTRFGQVYWMLTGRRTGARIA